MCLTAGILEGSFTEDIQRSLSRLFRFGEALGYTVPYFILFETGLQKFGLLYISSSGHIRESGIASGNA
jgi:hypothetical protein